MAAEAAIGATGLATSSATSAGLSGTISGSSGKGGASLLGAFASVGLETGGLAGSSSPQGSTSFREGLQQLLSQINKGTDGTEETAGGVDTTGESLDTLPAATSQAGQASSGALRTQQMQVGGTATSGSDSQDAAASLESVKAALAAAAGAKDESTSAPFQELSSQKSVDSTASGLTDTKASKASGKQKSTDTDEDDGLTQAGNAQIAMLDLTAQMPITAPTAVNSPQTASAEVKSTDSELPAVETIAASASGGSAAAQSWTGQWDRTEQQGLATAVAAETTTASPATQADQNLAAGSSGSGVAGAADSTSQVVATVAKPEATSTNAVSALAVVAQKTASTAQQSTDTVQTTAAATSSQSTVDSTAVSDGAGQQVASLTTATAKTDISDSDPVSVLGADSTSANSDKNSVAVHKTGAAATRTQAAKAGTRATGAATTALRQSVPAAASTADASASGSKEFGSTLTASSASSVTGTLKAASGSSTAGATSLSGTQSDVATASASDSVAAVAASAQGSQEKTSGSTASGGTRSSSSERKSSVAATGAASSTSAHAASSTASGSSVIAGMDSSAIRQEADRASSVSGGRSMSEEASEAFSSMDNGELPGKGVWVHTSSRQAEAGYQDPTLGWVSVRADMSGGSVHAMLIPNSASAADALSSQVAGLHGYLSERNTSVSTVTVASPDGGQTAMDMSQGSGGQGGQGQTSGSSYGSAAASQQILAGSSSLQAATSQASALSSAVFGVDGGTVGRHLSVMA